MMLLDKKLTAIFPINGMQQERSEYVFFTKNSLKEKQCTYDIAVIAQACYEQTEQSKKGGRE